MKKYSFHIVIVLILLIAACSHKEEKFELFSPEAFAYSMDSGWELNASCRVKGFKQNEEENNFKAKLSFSIDLLTPDGKILPGIGEGLIDQSAKERIIDLPVETQIQLDSTYKAGKYTLTFNVTDDFSGKNISIKKEFDLTN